LVNWLQDDYPDIGVVVVDSLKDLAVGLADDATGAAVNIGLQAVLASGRQLLVLHHDRKLSEDARPGKARTLDSVYGSRWITAGTGSVLYVAGEPGASNVTLHHLKQPSSVVGPIAVHHDHEAGNSTSRDLVSDVLSLALAAGPTGVTLDEVAQACFGSTDKKDREKARRSLLRSMRAGDLTHAPGASGGRSGGGQPARWSAS
jgi:replicative DNA helicase